MGEAFDWNFSYDTQGSEIVEWTIRLENFGNKAEVEAIRAAIALTRNRSLTEDEQQDAQDLHGQYARVTEIGRQMHELLRKDDIAAAEAFFETQTLELRREISRNALSLSSRMHSKIKDAALKSRLAK